MSPQQFFSATLQQQTDFLTNQPHACERFEPGFMIMLFEVNGWLLEAYYHRRAGFLQFEELTPALAAQRYSRTAEPDRLPAPVQAWMAANPRTGLLRKLQNRCLQIFQHSLAPSQAQPLVRSKAS